LDSCKLAYARKVALSLCTATRPTAAHPAPLSCCLNRSSSLRHLTHSPFLSLLRQGPRMRANTRCCSTTASPDAPCSLPHSSTGLFGCIEAALDPSRRNFPSERRSHITGIRAWSSLHVKCMATSRIACVPSSLICTRSSSAVAELHVQNVALIVSLSCQSSVLVMRHGRGAACAPSRRCARSHPLWMRLDRHSRTCRRPTSRA